MYKLISKILLSAFIIFAFKAGVVSAATSDWDFSTPGDYTSSNATKVEVSAGLGTLLLSAINPNYIADVVDDTTINFSGLQDVVVIGDYAYVISFYDSALSVVDISNPAVPVIVGTLVDDATMELANPEDLFIEGNYAYITSTYHNALEIVDISDPTTPTHVGSIVDDATTELNKPNGTAISGNHAFVVSDDGFEVIDISDPTTPTHVTGINFATEVLLYLSREIKVVGDYAYITAIYGDVFIVMDISDPTAPSIVGTIADDATTILDAPSGFDIQGDYAYVTSIFEDGVQILDISDPTNPTAVGSIVDDATMRLLDARTIVVEGDYAYVGGNNDDGIQVLDISDPTNPVHEFVIFNFATSNLDRPMQVAYSNGHLYVAANDSSALAIISSPQGYYSDTPYVTSNTAQTFIQKVNTFSETLGTNNEGSLVYQVSSDNGTTWKYWNGTAWAVTTLVDGTETSSAVNVNMHVSKLDTNGGDFLWRAFFVSDGTEQVELDQIDIIFDVDSDNVDDTTEDAVFNSGDGNNDGLQDSVQDGVTSNTNPVTGEYAVIETKNNCNVTTNSQFVDEASLAVQDDTADYPVGLVDMTINCASPGDSADIKLYYSQEYDTSSWVYKKYSNVTNTYTDISGIVTYGAEMIDGANRTTVSFTVTDGGPYDEDGVANGVIVDPGGPAVIAPVSTGRSTGGSVKYICKDPTATNYNDSGFGRHKASKCEYSDDVVVVTQNTPTESNPFGGQQCSSDMIITQFMKNGDTDGKYGSYEGAIINDIDILQAHINRLLLGDYGYEAAGPIDGIFRSLTERGVERIQMKLNQLVPSMTPLVIDGIVGPFTRAAINNSCGVVEAVTA